MRRSVVNDVPRSARARSVRAGMAGLLLGVAAVAGTTTAASAVSEPCWADAPSDLDGGGPDAVLGLPSYDLPGKPDAGAIVVFSNVAAAGDSNPSAPSARTLLTADDFSGLSSQAGARFGASVVVWRDTGSLDDADNCADLLVGAPGQAVGGKPGAGQVSWLAGSADGLSGVRRNLDESTLTGTGGAQAGAGFGASIAAETLKTIAIGAPGRDVAGALDAGRVDRLDYQGSAQPDVSVIQQGGTGAGTPEPKDRFGEVLRLVPTDVGPILLIGVPHEDVGSRVDAGAVGMAPPDLQLSLVNQDSQNAGGTAEAGDRYGASVDGYVTDTATVAGKVVIGVPGEDLKGKRDAGMVSFASFDLGGTPENGVPSIVGYPRTLSQNSWGIRGDSEAGDRYGAAVLTGEFGQDNGALHLVAGSPLEDLGATADAGMLAMTFISPDGAPNSAGQPDAWTQDSPGVAGGAERGDRFGAGLSSVRLTTPQDDFDPVWSVTMVTVPREDIGAVADAGMAYLGVAPGEGSVALVPPVLQAGAGLDMVPMQIA